jgi:FkbM family methyltransferase
MEKVMIKEMIKTTLGPDGYRSFTGFVRDHFYGWHSRYFAEYGEDSIINCLTHYKRNGFYVDVGAFHPKRLSSTYYFYKNQNWNGVVIEPNPVNANLFRKKRSRDTVVNMGVSKTSGELKYFMFQDASQNTFSEEFKNDRVNENMEVIQTKSISVAPLSEILGKHIDNNQEIDYLNVDVEGLDLEVLQSNDWSKYRPKTITVEDIHFDADNPKASDIYSFVKKQGYSLKAVSYITLIFSLDE